jgi:hypothetical protein
MALYTLYRKLPIYEAYRRATIVRLYATVHNDNITLVHIRLDHRGSANTKEECRRGVLNKELQQVELLTRLLISQRGKSSTHLTKHIQL